MLVSELVPKFIALLSSKLDAECRTIGNWKSLANEFGIKKQISDQFGVRGSGPTEALFSYIQTDRELRYLTMGQLHEHFCEMERNDLVVLLKKRGYKGEHLLTLTRSIVEALNSHIMANF